VRTDRTVLRIGRAEGTIREVPMRYNASHQRGYRCFVGPLSDAAEDITEDTPRSFEGQSLFDALAEYRRGIESDGWRLLHAAARLDCWPKPDAFGPYVQRLTPGVDETEAVNGLEEARFDQVGSLDEQREAFEAWMKGLKPIYPGRVRPKAGHEHDKAEVDFSLIAIQAGEYLVDGKPNPERWLKILRSRNRGPRWNPKGRKGS
jgi:hypothetical protein